MSHIWNAWELAIGFVFALLFNSVSSRYTLQAFTFSFLTLYFCFQCATIWKICKKWFAWFEVWRFCPCNQQIRTRALIQRCMWNYGLHTSNPGIVFIPATTYLCLQRNCVKTGDVAVRINGSCRKTCRIWTYVLFLIRITTNGSYVSKKCNLMLQTTHFSLEYTLNLIMAIFDSHLIWI